MTLTIDLEKLFPVLFVIFAVVAIVVVVVFIFDWLRRAFRRLFWRRRSELSRQDVERRWQVVDNLMKSGELVSLRLAVMEADKILDEVLKSMSMPGTTFAERLKFASHKYYRLKKVWWAHKIRNQLAHETTFNLQKGQARSAVKDFYRALREIGAIK